jgi:IS1 family transposase
VKIDKLNSSHLGTHQEAGNGLHTGFLQRVLEHDKSIQWQNQFLSFRSLPFHNLFISEHHRNGNSIFVVWRYGVCANPLGRLAVNFNQSSIERQWKPSGIGNVKFDVKRLIVALKVRNPSPVLNRYPLAQSYFLQFNASLRSIGGFLRSPRLPTDEDEGNRTNNDPQPFGPFQRCVPLWRVAIGFVGIVGGSIWGLTGRSYERLFGGLGIAAVAIIVWATGHETCEQYTKDNNQTGDCAAKVHANTVTHKLLTSPSFCNTLIAIGRANMANVLSVDKQVAIVSALAEGSSIRAIERMTGVHRDTIMRLGVRVGQGCASLLDEKMRGLSCRHLQFDEIWGFIGKKERHMRPDDNPTMGDVWTFCAIDSDTKIVPSFKCGKRDSATANAFVADVASRMKNRVQISSDSLRAYVEAIELSFGSEVDFAQIIKTYTHDDSIIAERKFSAPEVVTTEKKRVVGRPDMRLASTSYIERLNGTTRLHMRRLTRLTYAFSKKRENFETATALHFAYYNFVKRHITLRCTPAMTAGIERDFWTVGVCLAHSLPVSQLRRAWNILDKNEPTGPHWELTFAGRLC